jgi:hypothetical protein
MMAAGIVPGARPSERRPTPGIEQPPAAQPGEINGMIMVALGDAEGKIRWPARVPSTHRFRLRIFPKSIGKLNCLLLRQYGLSLVSGCEPPSCLVCGQPGDSKLRDRSALDGT